LCLPSLLSPLHKPSHVVLPRVYHSCPCFSAYYRGCHACSLSLHGASNRPCHRTRSGARPPSRICTCACLFCIYSCYRPSQTLYKIGLAGFASCCPNVMRIKVRVMLVV
jgi:hypothetical protein